MKRSWKLLPQSERKEKLLDIPQDIGGASTQTTFAVTNAKILTSLCVF